MPRRGSTTRAITSARHLAAATLIAATLAGCSQTEKTVAPQRPTLRPDLPRNATLTLNQIKPLPKLPASAPSTRPAGALQAVQLFAQARSAMLAGQRFSAVQLLDEALALDPDSFELNLALGEAALGTSASDRCIPALQKAARINPESTEAYALMARSHMNENRPADAVAALRSAQATARYTSGDEIALVVDYMMVRSLTQGGYDLAARDALETLIDRVSRTSAMYRGPVEVMQVVQNPHLLFGEMAAICTRLGDYRSALAALEQAIAQAPDNEQYALGRVRLLMQMGRVTEAQAFVPEVISRFGSDGDVMAVLRDAFAKNGGDSAAIAQLTRAMERKGRDMNIGFALADLLKSSGQLGEARRVLQSIVEQYNYDPQAVQRLFSFYETQDQTMEAAALLVRASARRPDDLSEFAGPMSRLARLSRKNHLRLRDLQQLQVETWAEPARLYWIARLAEIWGRSDLGRAALEKAVRLGKPYPPAYRALLVHYWSRHDWDDARKARESNDLVNLAMLQHDNALAAELRGGIALNQKKTREASADLLEAMRLGGDAPELMLAYGLVQIMEKNNTEAERILLKINETHPLYETAYETLMRYYLDRQQTAAAVQLLQRWLAADPHNPVARLYNATILLLTHRQDAAEKALLELFDEYADNTEVLVAIQDLYVQTQRVDQFIKLLEQKRQTRPEIRELAERLVYIYAELGRTAEANRVLDDLKKTAAGDSDLLYYTSHLYGALEDNEAVKAVLEEVLKVDPNHSSAANDLGYFLADSGKDLDRAEKLVRMAVKEEPDNQAFLDSLGWVMYKRGDFKDAVTFLESAIAHTVSPDPIILDHLGDAYYRLGRQDDAIKCWQESLNRMALLRGGVRSELQTTGAQVRRKLQQHRANQVITVAPTAGL